MMRTLRRSRLVVAAACLAVMSACGVTDSSAGGGESAVSDLEMVVGNSPGGGYDTMARQIAAILESEGIAPGVRVMNQPGAGGTVALQQLVNSGSGEDTLMTTGLAVVGAVITNDSPVAMSDATPIARVLEEPMIIAVSADSPYDTIEELISAWKKSPGSVTAGGGAIGGPDYQQVMLLAETVGIDPKTVNFVTYDGGGELLPAMLGGKVSFTASGYAEWAEQIDSGEIRVLAVSGEEPIEAIDAPTLKEAGIDLSFVNWRGFVGPPGLSDERRDALVQVLEDLHESPAWQEQLEKNGQVDAFMAGDEFSSFVEAEQEKVRGVLTKAGLL